MAILEAASPHGWFGQSNVLGKPDTGGQVVYILDQVRALERRCAAPRVEQGLDIEPRVLVLTRLIPEAEGTLCNQRLEPIAGTRNARILRVPFRTAEGEVLPHWISRFQIWPYLERYAGRRARAPRGARRAARPDHRQLLRRQPGRLADVAAAQGHPVQHRPRPGEDQVPLLRPLLADNEDRYHFSCQFTADLIAMNTADFIITSTYQEIAGTDDSIGQYESYGSYTLPGLYRVVAGVDVYDPKFNIVSPGADEDLLPELRRRRAAAAHLHPEIEDLIFGGERPGDVPRPLADPDKPLLFTMAAWTASRTSPAWWTGTGAAALRERANLLVVGGHIDAGRSGDDEEREQIGGCTT
jgi:sucrose synthase